MKFPLARRHVALLALVPALALTGCGGDGKEAAPQPSAPSGGSSPVYPVPGDAPSGAGTPRGGAAPRPSASGDPRKAPANRFNECVRKEGVKLPSPGQTRRPSPEEVKKIQEALRACVRSMPSPPAAPRN